MAGQKGRDVLVGIGDGADPESFTLIAGMRTRTIALAASRIDATTLDSPGAWREALAGVKSVEVTGAGVFKDAASDARMRAAFFGGEAVRLQLAIPDFGTLAGPFLIGGLAYSGEHDGEAAFAIRLASAGELVFAAA